MQNRQIPEDLYGFIPVSVLASAMWSGGNEQELTIALKRVIESNEAPLLMLDEFDDPVTATDEARSWGRKYLVKCLNKPRLLRSHRVNARIGWRAQEILKVENVRALLPDIFGGDSQGLNAVQSGEETALQARPLEVSADADGAPKLGRKERQIMSIVECATQLGFDPLSIPRGGKQKIKDRSLQNTQLFTDSAFDNAWGKAVNETPPRIRTKDHEMFARRR